MVAPKRPQKFVLNVFCKVMEILLKQSLWIFLFQNVRLFVISLNNRPCQGILLGAYLWRPWLVPGWRRYGKCMAGIAKVPTAWPKAILCSSFLRHLYLPPAPFLGFVEIHLLFSPTGSKISLFSKVLSFVALCGWNSLAFPSSFGHPLRVDTSH